MLIDNDTLCAICDVELQFKIQLDKVDYKANSLELTMSGNWVYNYNNSSANYSQACSTDDIVDALYDEFIDGHGYVFWWYVRHMLKTLLLGNLGKIYICFDNNDLDTFIDYGGHSDTKNPYTFHILRIVAIRKSNFDVLEQLYCGSLTHRAYEILYLMMQYGNVDALMWCESKGISLTIGSMSCLRYVARLDIAKYLYSRNPGWFVGGKFSILDVIYYCNSTINREIELIEWLIAVMNIDVVDDLELNVEYIVDHICDCRDISMMCWLIDNYVNEILEEGEYTANRILVNTMNMLLPGPNHIINPQEYSEPYTDNGFITAPFCKFIKFIKGPVAIELKSARYFSPRVYVSALSFLARQRQVVGFTRGHIQTLATYNRLGALKQLYTMSRGLIDITTFKHALASNDLETIKWVKDCLVAADPYIANSYLYIATIKSELNNVKDKYVAWWLYTQINPAVGAYNDSEVPIAENISETQLCILLDMAGRLCYDFMYNITPEALKKLIDAYALHLGISVLRNMRRANPILFDECADYKSLITVRVCSPRRESILPWIAHECGYKLPYINNTDISINSNSFIYYKLRCEQRGIPFSDIYKTL